MSAGTLLAWMAVGLVVTSADPTEAPTPVFIILGSALFLAFTGTFSIVGFLVRSVVFRKEAVISRQVMAAFRQATLLSLTLVLAIFLNAKSLLAWWNVLLLIAGATLLELVLISARVKPKA